MTDFTPTPEQSTILNFARTSTDNFIIEAPAGAAKTTTLELIAHALPSTPILYLAFNKKTATEATERLPSNATARTLNALGHRAWAAQLGRHIRIDTKKNFNLISHHIAADFPPSAQGDLNSAFSDILRAVAFAKQSGYVPDSVAAERRTARPLTDDITFFTERCPLVLEPDEQHLVKLVLASSITDALAGVLDFDDQIFMPTVFPATFDRYPLVLVDEAQDLSLINHAMLSKIARRSRLGAVGDPCQAIYGFRGAHEDSMDSLAQRFSMTRFFLTTSFRCPRTVIDLARERAPDITAPDWAKPGSVTRLTSWTADDLPPASTVICRSNAPLFRLALKLLRAGRIPRIEGRDVLTGLKNRMRKLGKPGIRRAQLLTNIDSWYARERERDRDLTTTTDTRDAMRVFAEATETLDEALTAITRLASITGDILLLTGHKSKGLEFPDVYFLDEDLCKPARGQDLNIRYVIITRSQDRLTFLSSGDYLMAHPED